MSRKPTQEYQVLYDTATDVLINQDFSGRITRVNRAFERVTGLNRRQVLGTSIYDRIAPELRGGYRQRVLERIGGAPALPFEAEVLGTAGWVYLELTLDLLFENGLPTAVRCVGRNIVDQVRWRTDREAADAALLRQTEEIAAFSRYLQLLHRLTATNYSTLDELFSDYLSTGLQIFSLECGAIVELTSSGPLLRKTAGPRNAQMLEDLAGRVLAEEATLIGPLPGRADAAGPASFHAGTPIFRGQEVFGVLLFWSEISQETHPQSREMIEMMARGMESAIEHRRMTEELEYRAHHDSLTSLANRATLMDRLQLEIEAARREGTSVGVIFMDVDRFKELNDSRGHATGDLALQEIAQRFRSAAAAGVLVARVGGDEFAAVVPNIRNEEEAAGAATQLLESLAGPLDLNGEWRHVTASSGVAVSPQHGENGATLLVRADAAMYRAKQAGGNCVRVSSVPADSVR